MIDPRQVAYDVVDRMLAKGLAQGHQQDSWRTEPMNNHIGKGIRHLITHQLMTEGNQKPDGELHLENALCRCALALTQEIEARSNALISPSVL